MIGIPPASNASRAPAASRSPLGFPSAGIV
jgi:hypothetical protein